MDRKRHISAPDESHSDSESASLMSDHHPSTPVHLLPRPRSSATLDDLVDSSSDSATSTSTTTAVDRLVSNVGGSTPSVCTILVTSLKGHCFNPLTPSIVYGHTMLYRCTSMATVGIKGLKLVILLYTVETIVMLHYHRGVSIVTVSTVYFWSSDLSTSPII